MFRQHKSALAEFKKEIMRASLDDAKKKSGIQVLMELAACFESKDDYIQYLEGMIIIAVKDALCIVDEKDFGLSHVNRAEFAFGRAAAFLITQEMRVQERARNALCGREATIKDLETKE